jgi:hypothetical protein
MDPEKNEMDGTWIQMDRNKNDLDQAGNEIDWVKSRWMESRSSWASGSLGFKIHGKVLK